MIRLQKSETLQRMIRQDDPEDLAIPTWTLIRDSFEAGRAGEAVELMDYELSVCRNQINSLTFFRNILFTRLAEFDEEEVGKLERQRYSPWVKDWLQNTPGVEESLQRFSEQFRAMQANITITDEPDRYVMSLDPCGTGGRLRRSGSVGSTKKAYPWSWNKSGVCYYCTHCCIFQEILPIEIRGYPICVTQYPDRPEDPCVHFYYKKPELVPEEYFTRIGKAKTIK